MSEGENPAVTRFRDYLRIKTVQPNPDYESCKNWLLDQAKEIGLSSQVLEYVKGKPIVLLTWIGRDPQLPAILLNSHTDVVPVFEEKWSYDPFEAFKNENGDIFARGAQDMKCVGASYLEAIRCLKDQDKQPCRTIHLSYVPDEEIGGCDGMKLFVKSDDFKKLNIGFALDEGISCSHNALKVFYGERAPWWINVTTKGNTGHGSQFIHNTAVSKLHRIINRFMEFRESQERQLEIGRHKDGRKYTLGDVTTINLTKLEAGVQHNVIPQEAKAGFDVRISPNVDLKEFKELLENFVHSEPDTTLEYAQYHGDNSCTSLDDDNVWWVTFRDFCDVRNISIEPEIFPAATDSRYLRERGIPALGVSYIKNTPILLHDHNERINENLFLEGIDFYTDLITHLANIQTI
ncbi:17561_t:CDS:2 [Funneliformis geosporum]|uniref:N-acyl-aliphatic-L-amino acid amidohydrolase n=1 Tax=Funneliformis geosporum TaxID=1117311 RepID=A0A9W4X5Z6_9GLOM|nr:7504_t:CDS:2 [Funneliformis geosporum]CAI2190910.1 17561_t:CDS:2 [Funneliformis geosporum]